MLEGTIQIGEALYDPEDKISNFILDLKTHRGKKQLNVLKFKFNLKDRNLTIDANEEIDKNAAIKYRFVGSASGSRSPQWYVSSTSSNYHLTETFYNLSNLDFEGDLNGKIKQILEIFYVDFGEELGSKYRYGLNLNYVGIIDITMEEFYSKITKDVKNKKDLGKVMLEGIKKEFDNYLKTEMNINPNEIGLYTIFIDEEPLSNFKEYEDMVVNSISPETGEEACENKGVCSSCGSFKNLTSNMTKTKIKYYTTNQFIFASDINRDNYYKNMQMCPDCMFKYLTGENYILNNMKTKLAAFDVYIIPQYVYGNPINARELDIATKQIINSFNSAKTAKGVENLRNEINYSIDLSGEDSYFFLDFIFFKRSQKSTKVQRMVKDVNPSIFEDINLASNKAMEDFVAIFGSNYRGNIDLSTIYYMNPIKQNDKNEATQYRDILGIYDAVLTKGRLNRKHLIKNLVECIKIIEFDKKSYNINPKDESLEFFVVKANMYIKFLEYMNCLKEGRALDVNSLNIDDKMKNYIEKLGYGEQETAMLLLGYLISKIGNKQYKKPGSDGNKPILNKINFNGLDKIKIKRLVNEVFNKLNQEKILVYNEFIFFEMKRLLDSNIDEWYLNKDESLFYLLSGYSYGTVLPMLKEGVSDDK